MSIVLLFALAACGPGLEIDAVGNDGNNADNVTDQTAKVTLAAGLTGTWNYDTHQVENIRELEEAKACLNDPANTCVLTPTQLAIEVGSYTTSYSYNLGDFTFTGDVTKDMEDSTDFTGELDVVEGLIGTRLECDGTLYDKPFTTKFEELDGDPSTIDADKLAWFYINGPLFTTDYDAEYALLTEDGFYFAGHNTNVGDFYVECDFD